jgi:hypothetical protein
VQHDAREIAAARSTEDRTHTITDVPLTPDPFSSEETRLVHRAVVVVAKFGGDRCGGETVVVGVVCVRLGMASCLHGRYQRIFDAWAVNQPPSCSFFFPPRSSFLSASGSAPQLLVHFCLASCTLVQQQGVIDCTQGRPVHQGGVLVGRNCFVVLHQKNGPTVAPARRHSHAMTTTSAC